MVLCRAGQRAGSKSWSFGDSEVGNRPFFEFVPLNDRRGFVPIDPFDVPRMLNSQRNRQLLLVVVNEDRGIAETERQNRVQTDLFICQEE